MRDVHARENIGKRDIALTRVKTAIVDDENYQRVAQFKWHAASLIGRLYAASRDAREKK